MMGIVVWIRSRARAGVWGLALAVVGTVAAPGAGSPQPAASIDARIWLDRGSEAVMERGDRARVYYRTSRDAYVAIFRVDTDGTARLVHPRYPGEDHYVRAGREYRLLFPRSSYWHVDDDPGVGYFFLVASATPFDFGRLHWSSTSDAWDLSAVGATVYSDPYVAVDAYVSVLIPGWRRLPYGVHVTEYHVG
ncbi:MAG: DUF4384 domain-containing protein, partial [Gemmatimonadetes bacterium]|nr:DUF4384 domain-containing protein [Gemmatimonadota bacterium]NIR80675.1 DUF4384 domain-containing protein [Gemmatimonadota bacterium]NIT89466.1 DUF4384 domain-containing protein [Gemmatimonadota bacterium]NIU33269.1 DUF4384 domain-containing protein [Gemmatimonadota bacterium]NIU37574.1 DUF4384 domain-containing protein [Gemmatimonadota bacterium]